MNASGLRWSLETPAVSAGAVAMIRVSAASGEKLDDGLGGLGIPPLPVGQVRLADLCGADRGLVARWNATSVTLMPHGGGAVVRRLCEALVRAGIEREVPSAEDAYPEAADLIEARMLAAIAGAASPLAVPMLLEQPALWRRAGAASDAERDRALRWLIVPPLVVAVGRPNIGKSTLANALAGRNVSVVADEPGTTRDYVGVLLELAGLAVRYVDTPGIRSDAPEVEALAARAATELAEHADLVLWCADSGAVEPEWSGFPTNSRVLKVALRADLGPGVGRGSAGRAGSGWAAVEVCAHWPESLERLAIGVRNRLIPPGFLASNVPWKFWEDQEGSRVGS
ncbi:MAG: GTPase [Phycisphaerales bacterium]|nr:50S ribosome-binding GTPase [Planctomycetota bacterium]